MPLGNVGQPAGNQPAAATLPQFNLSPSLGSQNGDSQPVEDPALQDEEKDIIPDMPGPHSTWLSMTGSRGRSHTLNRSASRQGRLNSSMRASNTIHASFARMQSSAKNPEFEEERKEVLHRLASEAKRDVSEVLVSARDFESAVLDRTGSTVFATRLFESQNPEGADAVPAERLVDALLTLEHASLEEHLRITFELLDTHNDGTISRENLTEILKVAFNKLKIPTTDRQLERVSDALIQEIIASRGSKVETLSGIDEEEMLMESKIARINSGIVMRTIRFDELVKKLQSLIEEVEQDHIRSQSIKRSPVGKLRVRMHKAWLWLADIRQLPFFILFWIGMAMCFFTGYWQNWRRLPAHVSGAAYPLAKAFAQMIQPLAFLLLIAVCRRTVTYARETPLRYILPLDESISFHRLCGYLIFIASLGHTCSHVANYTLWASDRWQNKFDEPSPTAKSLWGSSTSITGYIMWFALLMGYPFAVWYPRKAKLIEKTAVGKVLNNFTYFSVTHIAMWLLFYVGLILHPWPGLPRDHFNHRGTTWIYVIAPLVLYIAERTWRLIRNVAFRGDLLDIELIPGAGGKAAGGVTVLRMRRPRDFFYKPGMYMFINVPKLSVMEWHPFTITSAPGDPYVSVHIRAAGDWTKELYEFMDKYAKGVESSLPPIGKQLPATGSFSKGIPSSLGSMSLARSVTLARAQQSGAGSGRSDLKVTSRQATFAPGAGAGLEPTLQRRRTRASLRACNWDPLPSAPLVLMDGPYSAPALHWEEYEVLLLVGAGIGVTPFASVLADMVNRVEANYCTECGAPHSDGTGLATEKIYFHWVVKDSTAPNYFASTLETISSDDQLGLVEPRIHLTGAAPKSDGNGPDLHHIIVRLGQEALHRQSGVDVVIGLKSKVVTEFGRPNWKRIVSNIAENHPGQTVGVFVCGPPPFTKAIKGACQDYNIHASTRLKILDAEEPDVEAAQPALKKTIFDFYEEYF